MSIALASFNTLAGDRADRFAIRSRRAIAAIKLLKLLLQRVGLLFRMSAIDGAAAQRLRGSAKFLNDEAVWIRGARASLGENPATGLIDADLSLQRKIDRNIASALRIRAHALKLKLNLEQRNFDLPTTQNVLEAAQALALAATELHDEANAFKWAMLEHDADRSARETGWVAHNAEEVRELLAKM